MSHLFQKYFIAWDIIFAVLLLIAFDQFKRKSAIRKYRLEQKKRIALSETDFCKRLSVDENNASLVRAIRESLAKRPSLNPERIYPEDELWDDFDFQIDDFFDETTKKYFRENYEYFPDDVRRVGELVKFLIQVHAEAEPRDSN
jgi:hypothetical protein